MGSGNSLTELRFALKKDFEKYAYNVARYAAHKIADELTEVASYHIHRFYEQYNPEDPNLHNGVIYYRRHWNFYNTYHRYYKNHGKTFSGGVAFTYPPDVYRGTDSSPMFVFKRVYGGMHGIASATHPSTVPMYWPSPMRRIKDEYDYIKSHSEKYVAYGEEMARKDAYIKLRFN